MNSFQIILLAICFFQFLVKGLPMATDEVKAVTDSLYVFHPYPSSIDDYNQVLSDEDSKLDVYRAKLNRYLRPNYNGQLYRDGGPELNFGAAFKEFEDNFFGYRRYCEVVDGEIGQPQYDQLRYDAFKSALRNHA